MTLRERFVVDKALNDEFFDGVAGTFESIRAKYVGEVQVSRIRDKLETNESIDAAELFSKPDFLDELWSRIVPFIGREFEYERILREIEEAFDLDGDYLIAKFHEDFLRITEIEANS